MTDTWSPSLAQIEAAKWLVEDAEAQGIDVEPYVRQLADATPSGAQVSHSDVAEAVAHATNGPAMQARLSQAESAAQRLTPDYSDRVKDLATHGRDSAKDVKEQTTDVSDTLQDVAKDSASSSRPPSEQAQATALMAEHRKVLQEARAAAAEVMDEVRDAAARVVGELEVQSKQSTDAFVKAMDNMANGQIKQVARDTSLKTPGMGL